ncbi:uncharacterized protein HMPREF1541_01735 [Cyphellophora europaea CBS 101466]|uniref:NADH-ubiquinone oxidoreductase B15 subunit n=1 Tax=Cyphellophora europaea (strain CBS 101466) TaxID=1220924 RepID=W2S3G6_CYPE1|nr:uncharacterized protein HMPREF1541_01735 [Cyphellophora europaea CBS 101466]ETN42578.1 hypothetical protein HMPREF1541_01735 [Cyphellophora europaea CBS 101466]
MAGPNAFRTDPAIQKYNGRAHPFPPAPTLPPTPQGLRKRLSNKHMKNRWKYFRWTPRVALVGFMYGVFVPSLFATVFYRTDGKWDMRGKLRGDTISEW